VQPPSPPRWAARPHPHPQAKAWGLGPVPRSRQRCVGRCRADAGADPGSAGKVWAARALRREPGQRGGGSSCSAGSASWLAAARQGPLRGDVAANSLLCLSLSVSRKLLKAGRSLDAGPNGGRTGARRTPPTPSKQLRRGTRPAPAPGGRTRPVTPWPPRGDGPDPECRVRPRRCAAALSQDYTQSCSLRTPALVSS